MLTVIVSTMGAGIAHLHQTVAFKHPAVRYLIICQNKSGTGPLPEYLSLRPDIQVVLSDTTGLAVSRNIGLEHCQTRYGLLADDDVRYLPDGMNRLLTILESEAPDFALFQIQTLDGEPPYKRYPPESYAITALEHWVSSIEIVVNVAKLRATAIRFDERFGLGAPLDRGEEEIFVSDLIRQGWKGRYFPIPIVQHPYESSGKNVRKRKDQLYFQGAFDARLGIRSIPHRSLLEYIRNPRQLVDTAHYRRGRRFIKRTSRRASVLRSGQQGE